MEFVGYRAFPDECDVTALNPQVHFETAAEYAESHPEYDWDSDEAADVLGMLLIYCARAGVDLDQAMRRKWLKWLETDG